MAPTSFHPDRPPRWRPRGLATLVLGTLTLAQARVQPTLTEAQELAR